MSGRRAAGLRGPGRGRAGGPGARVPDASGETGCPRALEGRSPRPRAGPPGAGPGDGADGLGSGWAHGAPAAGADAWGAARRRRPGGPGWGTRPAAALPASVPLPLALESACHLQGAQNYRSRRSQAQGGLPRLGQRRIPGARERRRKRTRWGPGACCSDAGNAPVGPPPTSAVVPGATPFRLIVKQMANSISTERFQKVVNDKKLKNNIITIPSAYFKPFNNNSLMSNFTDYF